MTIYAEQSGKGRVKYINENGILVMEMAEVETPSPEKKVTIRMPKHENEVPLILIENMDMPEVEKAFEWLDIAIHDDGDTSRGKDEKIYNLERRIEMLEAEGMRIGA